MRFGDLCCQQPEYVPHFHPNKALTLFGVAGGVDGVLTDTKLRALLATPPTARTELPDGSISGLMLRAGPRGKPTWTLRYAVTGRGGATARGKALAGRKFYRISLGDYPTVSIKEARAKASVMLAEAAKGNDPIVRLETQAVLRRGTMAELAEDFMNAHVRGRLRSAGSAEWIVRDHILPRLGDIAPRQVTRATVVALLNDLARHATPTAALDTRKWLSIMFSWAVDEGRVEANPVTGVKAPIKSKTRERVLSIEEARAVWRAARAERYPSGTLICLLMLTGARLREIGHAQLGWLDRTQACLDIPGDAYKTGDSTIIPLLPDALALFEKIPRPPNGDYLISSNGGRRPVWTATPEALARIRQGAEADIGRAIDSLLQIPLSY